MSRLFQLCVFVLFTCAGLSAHASNAAPGVRLPDFTRTTLPNGATVLLMPRHDVPMIAASVLVRGGALADAPGKEGTASLLSDLLEKGAGNRDALAFAQTVDGAGGSLGFASSREAVVANAQFLAKDADVMLALLGDALLRPRMEATEFDKLKKRAIDGIASAKDGDPRGLIGEYTRAWLYQQQPYARPAGGDETSLARITLDDLKTFRAQQMGGDRLIIAISGDFNPATLGKQVAAVFGGWGKAAGTLPQVTAASPQTGRRVLLVDKPGATQTYFTLANIGTFHNDPNEAAQNIVQTIFGGRFTSMINTALRIKSGLSYGANSALERPRTPGVASITSYTKTETTQAAIDLAIATLTQLHTQPLDAQAIDSAKHYVAGQFAPRMETAPQLAAQLAQLALYGDSRESVDGYLGNVAAATPAQVNAARSVFPVADNLVIVAIGDASKIRSTLKAYGPVTDMKLTDPRYSP
jgi:predicted Zn-dependent peptidase